MDASTVILSRLEEMRKEQREDHRTLSMTVNEGFNLIRDAAAKHEREDVVRFAKVDNRLVKVEGTRRVIVWLTATVLSSALVGLFDLIANHLFKK